MNKETWTAVDEYYQELIIKPDPRFEKILEVSNKEGLPTIQIPPSLGAFLELLVRGMGAKRVLEIGTLGGYSTAWLASGLPEDGNLISLEIDPKHADVAQKNISMFEFVDKVSIKVGDALESLREMVETNIDPFGLIFIDAEKSQYRAYLEWSIKLSRPGTLIIADNVVRRGEIINKNSTDASVLGIREFNQSLSEEPRLKATVLQTVGAKRYDGFTMMVVDPEY